MKRLTSRDPLPLIRVAGLVEARLKSYGYQPRDRRSPGSLDNDMAMRSPSLQQDYDLPTIEAHQRRQFELHRIKVQRRFSGGDTGSLHLQGVQSLFSLVKGQSLYRTIFSFADISSDPGRRVTGDRVLDFLELYAFDLFCHWNLDGTSAVRNHLQILDRVIERLCAQAERLGLKALLVVDHGQERVRHTLNLCRILKGSGVPRNDYLFYIEVCNARFWLFIECCAQGFVKRLSRFEGATSLTAAGRVRRCVPDH